MVRLKVDGQELEVAEGLTLLQAAASVDIDIPTLCYHEGLGPYGSCRVCLVEIKEGRRKGLVSACTYPVEEGLEIETDNPRVRKTRKMMIELLVARCPDSPRLRELAEAAGVSEPRFEKEEEDCILCGLCVRACRELGINSIGFINRGAKREVATPFQEPSEVCLGCQACAYLCPTGAIRVEFQPEGMQLERWKTWLRLQNCPACGRPYIPERQQSYLKGKDLLSEESSLCPSCRRKSLGSRLSRFLGG